MKNTVGTRFYFEDKSTQYGFIVTMPNGEPVREARGNAPVMGNIAWNVEREDGGIVANDFAAVFPTPEAAEFVIKALRQEARNVGVTYYDVKVQKVTMRIDMTFEDWSA